MVTEVTDSKTLITLGWLLWDGCVGWARWPLWMYTLVPLSSRSIGSWARMALTPRTHLTQGSCLCLGTAGSDNCSKGDAKAWHPASTHETLGASAPSSSQGYYQGLEGIRVQLFWQPSPAPHCLPSVILRVHSPSKSPSQSASRSLVLPGPCWPQHMRHVPSAASSHRWRDRHDWETKEMRPEHCRRLTSGHRFKSRKLESSFQSFCHVLAMPTSVSRRDLESFWHLSFINPLMVPRELLY